MEKFTLIVTLILALSIASERIVEIIKGLSQFLSKADNGINEKRERRRRSWLQILSVGSAVLTTFLAAPVLPESILPDMGSGAAWVSLLALGLLASGGRACGMAYSRMCYV